MVYKDKFVASIRVNGKTLREKNEVVFLPFSSEYSVLLKNLSNRKALVKVFIDGRNVTEGGLVLHSKETVDLERFVDDDFKKGYKFKFIEKTDEIVEHRGDDPEDGLVRIEYQFEREVIWTAPSFTIKASSSGYYDNGNVVYGSNVNDILTPRSLETKLGATCCLNSISDEGITVEGGDSHQSFSYGYIGNLEYETHIIIFKLKGMVDDQEVSKPVTTKYKVKCKYCGKTWDSTHDYCGGCGARLVL